MQLKNYKTPQYLHEPVSAPRPSAQRRRLRASSASPARRLTDRLATLNARLVLVCLFVMFGTGLSYALEVQLEMQVSKGLAKIETAMKDQQDLSSYLTRTYSWSSISEEAARHDFQQATNVMQVSNH